MSLIINSTDSNVITIIFFISIDLLSIQNTRRIIIQILRRMKYNSNIIRQIDKTLYRNSDQYTNNEETLNSTTNKTTNVKTD